MSRLNQNATSGSWLPLWNANTKEPASVAQEDRDRCGKEPGLQREASEASLSRDSTPNFSRGSAISRSSSVSNSRNRRLSANRSVRPKTSTTSLASMTAGNWLGWTNRLNRGESALSNQDDENAIDDRNDEYDDEYDDDDNNDDDAENDEVDDHISQDRKRTASSWSFWNNNDETAGGDSNNNNNNNNNNNSKKPKDKTSESISNTILNSTPSIPSKSDLLNSTNKNSKADKSNSPNENEDDAVLYKPHDKPNQFKQINTHKNEDLKQNVIVPEWSGCLPHQTSSTSSTNSLANSIFGNASTTNNQSSQNSKMDLMNWRNVINQLSTRLGFSSQSLSSVVQDDSLQDNDESSRSNVEKEFNSLFERAYKLYGRSLAKLPPHKRACLPNYSKSYARPNDDGESGIHTYKYSGQSQLEEDASDPNSISITNDPMGNLLINHKSNHAKKTHPNITPSDIISQKAGPLRKIRKILIIGVHGFFPTKMIRPLIGSPKGTSLKFANEAEKSIIRYCIDNNLITDQESDNVSIQKIALEKEGKIFDRVEFFLEILTKWRKELNAADFIFIASHSQGCVVSIMLLAKLIRLGILDNPISKRIGILGMAGINNGPFYGVDKSFFMKAYSAIEHESMLELFQLTKFESEHSLAYKESIQIIINANVKICFVGSINDQLVPLYSALASHVFHPNIYRACYIDHSSQTPTFIQKLVSLCCHLQNLGYFDNNVLKEVSTVLAGPLTGGGHSKIYNDGKVYDLGVKFVLDTDDIVIPLKNSTSIERNITNSADIPNEQNKGFVKSGVGTYGVFEASNEINEIIRIPVTNQVYIKEYNIGKIGTNPFILPWCLRGLIFNVEKNWPNNNKLISVENGRDVGKTGYDEINELYHLFDGWKPDSKVLKDLKFRLNGIRASKL